MEYTVDGGPAGNVEFTFTTGEDGTVSNINSNNTVFVILFGYMGLTFSTPISVDAAQTLAKGIYSQLTS